MVVIIHRIISSRPHNHRFSPCFVVSVNEPASDCPVCSPDTLSGSLVLVRVLIVRTDFLEEVFYDFPENQGRGLLGERDSPAILSIVD